MFRAVVVVVVVSVLLVSQGGRADDVSSNVASVEQRQSSCGRTAFVADSDRYHNDQSCDKGYFNTYKANLMRGRQFQTLQKTGDFRYVPEIKTVTCPTTVQDMRPTEHHVTGLDTMWVVENTASTPVVLAWVHPTTRAEHSAWNANIRPPEKDPDSILQPGKWRALHTHEGHIFHVRSLNPDGTTGPVLLQHRTGLIPIGKRSQELNCKRVVEVKQEKVVPETKEKVVVTRQVVMDASSKKMDTNLTDPEPKEEGVDGRRTTEIKKEFRRTETHPVKRCNTIDLGFRNFANCPLHGYWMDQPGGGGTEPCHEHYKFHLGVNDKPNDFMWQWQANTAFEGTFVGHSFAFRLASNPNVLVDTYTVEPTQIIDCPGLQQATSVAVPVEGDLVSVGKRTSSQLEQVIASLNNRTTALVNQTATTYTKLVRTLTVKTL